MPHQKPTSSPVSPSPGAPDINQPLALLGGLRPTQFMKRHWQKKPLLIRQAVPDMAPLLSRAELFELASDEDVQSRLIQRDLRRAQAWRMQQGPFQRKALPALKTPDWTLLVQGVDLHHAGAAQLLQQFRFVPDARLDDVMVSYASDGGGVGPHFDSYDVFLLQVQGQRRWRIGAQKDLRLQEGVPLKLLADFVPEQEFVLNPGDMLYLPPRYAHDGIAQGECMTYSIGFRAPRQAEVASELLQRLADDALDEEDSALYRDAAQPAVTQPACIPDTLHHFAQQALQKALQQPMAVARALGEYLTEPKAHVWFDEGSEESEGSQDGSADTAVQGVVLHRRSKMMYDAHHVFLNGQSWLAAGKDAILVRKLADQRMLAATDVRRASRAARTLLQDWCAAGWLLVDNTL